jgi:hypothetical protein
MHDHSPAPKRFSALCDQLDRHRRQKIKVSRVIVRIS